MIKNKIGKYLGVFFKLAALAALVLAGLHFRETEVGYAPDESQFSSSLELRKQLSEIRENLHNKFPEAENPVPVTYQWSYAGKNYSVSQTLYSSVYEFYKSQPKTYTYFNELPENWEEEYYGMFVAENSNDSSISELLESIRNQGKAAGLSDDRLAELVVAFVQSIPYDENKASNILARTGNETMDYPYEVLFKNKGVCSDKSFLATVLLRGLGYGTAIFIFENENHMAVGISCPREYSNFDSGYCFVETTSVGNKIGIVPELKSNVGSAVGAEQIDYFGEGDDRRVSNTKLTGVKIFQKTDGREYRGIIRTVEVNNEIAGLKNDLAVLSTELNKLKYEIGKQAEYLADRKKKLNKYAEDGDVKKYNEQVEKYNSALSEYEKSVKEYNGKVKAYNGKVARYNVLIKL